MCSDNFDLISSRVIKTLTCVAIKSENAGKTKQGRQYLSRRQWGNQSFWLQRMIINSLPAKDDITLWFLISNFTAGCLLIYNSGVKVAPFFVVSVHKRVCYSTILNHNTPRPWASPGIVIRTYWQNNNAVSQSQFCTFKCHGRFAVGRPKNSVGGQEDFFNQKWFSYCQGLQTTLSKPFPWIFPTDRVWDSRMNFYVEAGAFWS